MGTQKNRLNETVLLSTQNICQIWWVRKYLHFYTQKLCLSKPMPHHEWQCRHFLLSCWRNWRQDLFCMLGNFACFSVVCGIFFQNWHFQKFLPSKCHTVWIQIRPNILSGLIGSRLFANANSSADIKVGFRSPRFKGWSGLTQFK